MKVILMRDVKGVGRAYAEVDAADGHALNYLIPKKYAVAATAAARKEAELRRAQAKERGALEDRLVEERLAALAEERIVIRKKANEQGHLYDAVDAKEVAEAAQLPVSAITLEKPIKALGVFDIPVAFGDSFGKLSVTVEAE